MVVNRYRLRRHWRYRLADWILHGWSDPDEIAPCFFCGAWDENVDDGVLLHVAACSPHAARALGNKSP